MDNLQDVLVEEGQGGKGQKIQEDSAAKTMIFLLLLLLLYYVIIILFVIVIIVVVEGGQQRAEGSKGLMLVIMGIVVMAIPYKQGYGVNGQWSW